MQSIILNYRFWVLAVLAGIATICIISEPITEELSVWLLIMLISKLIGVASAGLNVLLFKYWKRKGTIDELTKLIGE